MKILRYLLFFPLFITSAALAQNTTFSQKPFTDVPANSPYFQAIEYLRTQNVLKGYLDGTFKPDHSINRAEFVEFIINPLMMDTNNEGNCLKENVADTAKTVFFSDVSTDAWYAVHVCFARMQHLINGYPDGTFRPAASINFAEAAKIIASVFSVDMANPTTGEFWYRPYVQSLSNLHAIPVGITRFNQTLTRGEMAEIVYRLKVNETQKASVNISDLR